jgi:inorganic pyrophosphatase
LNTDLERGILEPHQARHQEGQASIRSQLLPSQGLSLELRCFPTSKIILQQPDKSNADSPQTWEDPNVVHPETKAKGDNDPLDVCEIGELVGHTGQVKQVKVLGAMALLDEGETDWKIIVIDVNDPLAPKLNDIEDVERHLPGLLRATNEWFRIYKIPDGKPENQFAFSGECKNRKYAEEIIHECSDAWERLITGQTKPGDVSLANVTNSNSPDRVDPSQLKNIPRGENMAPAPIDGTVDKWFFISGAAV